MDRELQARLSAIRQEGLYRTLRRVESSAGARIKVDGRELLNFSSNDYLGLASDGRLSEAVSRAVRDFGVGSAASRLICGSLAIHHELEQTLADFKGTEAALLFPSGYAAALGAITSLVDRNDIVILDKLVHASLVDGARLSGAKLRVYGHNGLDPLERTLRWAAERTSGKPPNGRILIVTESVFSMDGDQAPLCEIVRLKEKYGAWLMVDEAHATGLFGQRRQGLVEALGVGDRVEIQMGTLGKAVGAAGGYICGSRVLVDYLVNRARTFIFTTAPSPVVSAASLAGLRLLRGGEGAERCARLWDNVREVLGGGVPREGMLGEHEPVGRDSVEPARLVGELASRGSRDSHPTQPTRFRGSGGEGRSVEGAVASIGTSAIVPLMVGDEARALRVAEGLLEQGIFIPAVRYPTVPRGKARLRLTLSAAHTAADIRCLKAALAKTNLDLENLAAAAASDPTHSPE